MPDEVVFQASPKQFLAWKYLTDDVTTEIGYGGAAHGGKSYLGCEALTDFRLAYPGTGWLLSRKELLNLKRTTLLTLFKVLMEPKNKPDDAPKEQYENLKAQFTYMLAEAVNKHRIAVRLESITLPSDMTVAPFKEMFVEDLEQMKRKDADKYGKLKIIPKDEVKEHLRRSPDFGDALMMRMRFDLKPPTSGHVPPPVTNLVQLYYPSLGV